MWPQKSEESNPPGAAGALLNQTRLFDDLFLFIDAQKKQMFDCIDARHRIAQIVAKVSGDHSRAAQLFDKLWWYDQFVFDTSSLA